MCKWDDRWISLCNTVAGWSIDRSRQVGAVVVDARHNLVVLGWNGPPRGVDDTVEEIHHRPEKYLWYEHAERNAIYNAAADGRSLMNCTIFQNMYPCSGCARAIIQSGIKEVVTIEPDWDDPTYSDDFRVTKEMFKQTGIVTRYVSGQHMNRK